MIRTISLRQWYKEKIPEPIQTKIVIVFIGMKNNRIGKKPRTEGIRYLVQR